VTEAEKMRPITAPATDDARAWQGWGTALKPAWEPVIVARKPLSGTVADNVLRYGTGALNIDGCRVGAESTIRSAGVSDSDRNAYGTYAHDKGGTRVEFGSTAGRWPANVMHDGSAEVVAGFPDAKSGIAVTRNGGGRIIGSDRTYSGNGGGVAVPDSGYTDSGSAARFFYCAKASTKDREEGCDNLPARSGFEAVERKEGSAGLNSPRAGASAHAESVRNFHPTVKPTDLMRYLCRLVTPPAGLVLDPFCGSGSTGKAALLEGLRFVGVDLDPAHVAIAEARCQFAVDTVAEQAAAAEAPGAQLALF
jgi:site-specific DNA-methyltransferase (adenine-specific)